MLWILTSLTLISSVALASIDAIQEDQLRELQNKLDYIRDDSGVDTVKGITIGGWLISEPYITPSLYKNASALAAKSGNSSQIIDEFTLCDVLGYDQALSLLQAHWESWINEDDFRQISDDGFNLVRIPIGYWAWKQDNETNRYVDNITYTDPYVGNGLQLKFLEKALSWAQEYDLNVWIDLHGAPSSQNGFDNSGQRDLYSSKLGWLATAASRDLTMAVWNAMFESYLNLNSDSPIVGIEIMNEPLSPKLDSYQMTSYYYEAFKLYENERLPQDDTTFVIHDAFEEIGHWNLHFNSQYQNVSSQYTNISNLSFNPQSVLVDHHHYEVFSDSQLNNTQFQRILDIINYGNSIYEELPYHPAVVGEWSAAITDCATWLNGVGIGARYDGSYYNTTEFQTTDKPVGKCSTQQPIGNWTKQQKIQVRQFVEAQLATYTSRTSGWIFWTWKTESAAEWDYLKLKQYDLFPTPFDNYTYFNANGSLQPSVSSSLSKEATATSKSAAVAVQRPFQAVNGQILTSTLKTVVATSLLAVLLACVFL